MSKDILSSLFVHYLSIFITGVKLELRRSMVNRSHVLLRGKSQTEGDLY
jgi:hypothetical protein